MGDSTEMILIHGLFNEEPSCGNHNRGWAGSFDKLGDLSQEGSMTTPRIVSHEEWLKARQAHLAKEKEFTQLRDELARERRELPWVKVEKGYVFDAPEGQGHAGRPVRWQGPAHRPAFHVRPGLERGLPELLVLDRQLQRHRCASGASRHGVRRWCRAAPIDKLEAYKKRMGWTCAGCRRSSNDFNFDFAVSFAAGREGRRSTTSTP